MREVNDNAMLSRDVSPLQSPYPRAEAPSSQSSPNGASETWRVGPYEIKEQIGQGGMATVYRAWHTGLHRHEALKIPRRGFEGVDSEYIQRLLSEARMAARLHHPHIVNIHNISEDGAPYPYFSMDLIDGRNLAQLLEERGALSPAESLSILRQAASAVTHAHQNGVVHRDIKPENILVEETENGMRAKVVDFGISRAGEDPHGTRLTRSGVIVGTPEYMSPEQSGSGDVVGSQTDIYSLGVLAYEMLTGTPPFTNGDGVSRMAILISHVRDEPKPLFEVKEGIPHELNDAVFKALAKKPADRYATADEFAAAFAQAVEKTAPRETPAAVMESPSVPGARQLRGGWPALVTAVFIGVMIGWLSSIWANRDDPASAIRPPAANATTTQRAAVATQTSTPAIKKKQTLQRAIAFPIEERRTPTLLSGDRKITRKGQAGVRETVLEITTQGKKELARRVLSTRVVKQPVAQVELLGTRTRNIDNVALPKPAASPARSQRSTSSPRAASSTPRRRRSVRASSSTTRRRVRTLRRTVRPKPAAKKPRKAKPVKRKSAPKVQDQVFGTFRLPSSPTTDFRSSRS